MSDAFLEELAARLHALGVRGATARRVLAEAEDHLQEFARDGTEDPVRRFGDPESIARMVAAELATAGTCRAILGAFAALALAGLGYVVSFALVPVAGGWPDVFGGRVDGLGPIDALTMALLPQIAFVAGCLALLRALRVRRAPVVGESELRLLRRRSAIALAAAAGTLAAVAAFALDFQGELADWWIWATVVSCAVLALPLAAAGMGLSRSARLAAAPGGAPGDVFDDLAPLLRLRLVRRLGFTGHPWRFASSCAAAVGLVAFVAGWYAEGDPASGVVRGAFEALALLFCFAALGRILGLRRSKP